MCVLGNGCDETDDKVTNRKADQYFRLHLFRGDGWMKREGGLYNRKPDQRRSRACGSGAEVPIWRRDALTI